MAIDWLVRESQHRIGPDAERGAASIIQAAGPYASSKHFVAQILAGFVVRIAGISGAMGVDLQDAILERLYGQR